MIVRRRTDRDLPGCVRALALVHAVDGYPARWPVDPADWLTPAGYSTGWVAEDPSSNAIAGHVCVVRGLDDPMVATLARVGPGRLAGVSRLFVTGPARGLGVGAALLAAASSWAATADVRLMLDVVEDDAAAVNLYERLGWRWVYRRPADWLNARGQRPALGIYLAPEDG